MTFPTHIVAAAGYVFDKSGNILIVKTKNRGWDCTGGQVHYCSYVTNPEFKVLSSR
jgi:hypothetical protein